MLNIGCIRNGDISEATFTKSGAEGIFTAGIGRYGSGCPPPGLPVANEGLDLGSPKPKNITILVVTVIGQGDNPI